MNNNNEYQTKSINQLDKYYNEYIAMSSSSIMQLCNIDNITNPFIINHYQNACTSTSQPHTNSMSSYDLKKTFIKIKIFL